MSLTDEQGTELIRLLETGGEISPEWARVLFPPEKREYELVYHGKDREEKIIAETLAVPLQPVRTFGTSGPAGIDPFIHQFLPRELYAGVNRCASHHLEALSYRLKTSNY